MNIYKENKEKEWACTKSGNDFFNTEFDRFFEVWRNIESGREMIEYVELDHRINKFVVVDCYQYNPTSISEAMEISGYAWLVGDENEFGHRKYIDKYSTRNHGCIAYDEVVI